MTDNENFDGEAYRIEDGLIKVFAPREDESVDPEGNKTTNERMVLVAEIPEANAKDVFDGLGSYLADQKMESTGPPGQKPMHQQYAEVEPEP